MTLVGGNKAAAAVAAGQQVGTPGPVDTGRGPVRSEPQFGADRPARPALTVEPRGFGWVAGNLVTDPVLRFTGGGRAMARLRVACSDRVRDAESGEWRQGPTRFVDVTCFGALAENVAEYFKQGDRLVGGGAINREWWTGDDGKVHERFVLMARDLGPSVAFRAARFVTQIIEEAQ